MHCNSRIQQLDLAIGYRPGHGLPTWPWATDLVMGYRSGHGLPTGKVPLFSKVIPVCLFIELVGHKEANYLPADPAAFPRTRTDDVCLLQKRPYGRGNGCVGEPVYCRSCRMAGAMVVLASHA